MSNDDGAKIAGAALGAVRDALEAGDLAEAAEAVQIAAEVATLATGRAIAAFRLVLAPLEQARKARIEMVAADVPELVAPAGGWALPGPERTRQELAHARAWERFRQAADARPLAGAALSRLADVTGIFDELDAAARAGELAAEAAKLLADAHADLQREVATLLTESPDEIRGGGGLPVAVADDAPNGRPS